MIVSKIHKIATLTAATTILTLTTGSSSVAEVFRTYKQVSSAATRCVNTQNNYFGVKQIIRSPIENNKGNVTLEIVGGGEVRLTYDYDRDNKTLTFDLIENTSRFASNARVGRELDDTVSQCKAQYPD